MLEQMVKWSMCALMAFGALMSITSVGSPRKPLTGGQAATIAAVQALWIAAIIKWWD